MLDFKSKVRAYHLSSARDADFCKRTNQLYFNCEASHRGVGTEKRALCIVAPAGSGKTTLVNYHLDRLPYFQSAIDKYGDEVSPILRVKLPPASTAKSAVLHMLKKLRVDENYSKKPEPELPDIVLGHMKALGVKYLFLDELQHGVRGTKEGFIKRMQDMLKSLIDSDDWPLHAIFAGTEDVLPLLQDDQIDRRTNVMRLRPLEARYAKFVDGLIREIIVNACEMTYSFDPDDEVTERLMRAANYTMGTAILLLQETCFDAFLAGSNEITISHLQETYRTKTGCLKRDNIFEAANFKSIKPKNALADLLLRKEESEDADVY
ncbi:TniB family NTP-binding protein [Rhizobium mongolense]|uniref:TniB family NTP-binding protein n=1 Tax=Rhizobium mongolense TaxID=57676 RepID=UPI0034A4C1CF